MFQVTGVSSAAMLASDPILRAGQEQDHHHHALHQQKKKADKKFNFNMSL